MPHKHKKKGEVAKKVVHAAKKAAVKELAHEVVTGKGAYKVNRVPPNHLRGSGGYFGDFLSGIGHAVGGGVGSVVDGITSLISGFGAYDVKSNTVMTNNTIPAFGKKGKGVDSVTRVTHHEYVCDVVSTSTSFATIIQQASINPGNTQLFPWLSTVANQYEQYRFLGLVFYYRATSGESVSSSNPSLGQVISATQYNPYDAAFPNKLSMEEYQYCVSTPPYADKIVPIECAPSQSTLTRFFVDPTATADLRFVEQGAFTLAINGLPSSSMTCGELWVSYDVEFYKPKLPASGFNVGVSHFAYNGVLNALTNSNGTWISNANALSVAYSGSVQGGVGIVVSGATDPGDYIAVCVSGDNTTAANINPGVGNANASTVNDLSGSGGIKTQSGLNISSTANGTGFSIQTTSVSVAQVSSGPQFQFKIVTSAATDSCNLDVFIVYTGGNLGAKRNYNLDRRSLSDQMAELRSALLVSQTCTIERLLDYARVGYGSSSSSSSSSVSMLRSTDEDYVKCGASDGYVPPRTLDEALRLPPKASSLAARLRG